jgi:hypothetical protein
MAFISSTELVIGSGRTGVVGRGTKSSNADVVFATDKNGRKSQSTKNSFFSLRVSISQKIAKEARIINGDRVDVLFDRESTPQRGLLIRVNSGGWKIMSFSKSKLCRVIVRMGLVKGMPTVSAPAECSAVVTDEGILFDLPVNCSFDKNMRA